MIHGQRVLSDGSVPSTSPNERLSMDPPGYDPSTDQESLAMAYNSVLGDALMVWQDSGHATNLGLTGIWGRVWTGLLFADGFESGNTSMWSSTVP